MIKVIYSGPGCMVKLTDGRFLKLKTDEELELTEKEFSDLQLQGTFTRVEIKPVSKIEEKTEEKKSDEKSDKKHRGGK